MLTEAEAKTKWCPQIRFDPAGGGLWNNRGDSDGRCRCIASECMSWRWAGEERETIRNYHDALTVVPVPGAGHVYPAGWQYDHTDIDASGRAFDLLHRLKEGGQRTGYCGLAGKPC
jgi:hypothetical protein